MTPPVDPTNLAAMNAMLPPPTNRNDLGHGPLVMGVSWTFSALAIILVGVRFWLRIGIMAAKVQLEDWLMLLATVLNTACVSCLTVAFHYGFGKHDKSLLFSEAVNIAKWIWMSFTPGITCSIAARISIAVLLCRIFGIHKRLKWFLIFITVLQVGASIALALTSWLQIRPVQALWNPRIPHKAISSNVVARLGNVTGGLFALGDLAYVFGPVIAVSKLNMRLQRKIAIGTLLALSLFTMGCSIAKSVAARSGTQSTADKQYKSSLSLMWSVTEQTFVIMMGCAPTLGSLTKVKAISDMASSLGSLFKSRRSGTDGSGRITGDGYYELGASGKSANVSGVQSVETGKVRRTDAYTVEYERERERV
ncbi:unnamed protein product [Periconia digitata]|uniref:Rhodopsin domain-containing protein n=1 Tax=Periconia digitata TaxID=1303443 RepID=A0A9W4U2N1_9PLEO|nr:unnamed protein product [Periconia digitata]